MSNSLWNSSSFRLYGSDLWGTLLLKNKLTRTTRFLLLLNRRRQRKLRKKSFFYWHKRLNRSKVRRRQVRVLKLSMLRSLYRVRRVLLTRFYKKRFARGKLLAFYRSCVTLNNDVFSRPNLGREKGSTKITSKLLKFKKKRLLTYRCRPTVRSIRFLNGLKRYRPPARKPRMRFRKYLVDYLRRNDFDRLREPRLRRRHFLSRLVLNFRKFRNFYGNLTAKQFSSLVYRSKVLGSKSTFSELINFLELRADTVLFRSCLVSSFFMARQLISHKHVYLNNNELASISFCISYFDIISLYSVSLKKTIVKAVVARVTEVFKSRLTRVKPYLQSNMLKLSKEFSERDSRKLKLMFYRRSILEFYRGEKRFPLMLTKSSLVNFQSPLHLETNYVAFATSLIAEVFFKQLFYPFKIKRTAVEMFLYSRRGF